MYSIISIVYSKNQIWKKKNVDTFFLLKTVLFPKKRFCPVLIFKCNRFIELLCCKKFYFLFLIFCPLEFIENRTSKWVALIGFWIKICFFSSLHFAPRGTTRVGNLLFCSKSLILRSNYEQFVQITLDKRATVSELHRLLTKNEQPRENCSGCSWQKSNLSKSLIFFWVNHSFTHLKRANHSPKISKLMNWSFF